MIFDIDINEKFKILNKGVYLSLEIFLEYCNDNNIRVPSSVCNKKEYDNFIDNIPKSYLQDGKYPDWLLFTFNQYFINKYIEGFKYIAKKRYEIYIKNNNSFKSVKEDGMLFMRKVNNINIDNESSVEFTSEKLRVFLENLIRFYELLKTDGMYKLMWNLEVYIIFVLNELISNSENKNREEIFENIYDEIGWQNNNVLIEIYPYPKLLIKKYSGYIISRCEVSKFKNIINKDITEEMIIQTVCANEKYQDTIYAIYEFIERWNSNKKSVIILGSIIKGIVLGVEEHIRDYLIKYDKEDSCFYSCIKKLKPKSHIINYYYKLILPKGSNNIFFEKINQLCDEKESIEKYLMIYYHVRNYLAHNNIDMEKFFHRNDGTNEIKIANNVKDAVLIIIYLLNKPYTPPHE